MTPWGCAWRAARPRRRARARRARRRAATKQRASRWGCGGGRRRRGGAGQRQGRAWSACVVHLGRPGCRVHVCVRAHAHVRKHKHPTCSRPFPPPQRLPDRLSDRVSRMLASIERELDAVESKIGQRMHVLDTDQDGARGGRRCAARGRLSAGVAGCSARTCMPRTCSRPAPRPWWVPRRRDLCGGGAARRELPARPAEPRGPQSAAGQAGGGGAGP